MAIQVSEQQMERIARERFLDRVTAILVESYPDSRAQLQAEDTREEMRQLYAKAHGFGFSSELALARYVITAWILGLDFDTRFPAMAEILAHPTMTPAQKAEALEQVTVTLMDTLTGGVPQ